MKSSKDLLFGQLCFIFKIWAYGCNHRYAYLYIPIIDKVYRIFITDYEYKFLKEQGVPTSQSMRKKNVKGLKDGQ